jgi:D-alanyl-D-alanine carboxypeptidase
MHHEDNWSSALDIGRLSLVTVNHKTYGSLFKEIVSCKYYSVKSYVNPNHTYKWENTNKMLWENPEGKKPIYSGIKTGITWSAGPCLSCTYDSPDGSFKFLVVLVCSKSPEARWKEIPKLCEWAKHKILKVR